MAKNQGTLIGAPIRPNDSEDQYPSAYQSEIKGGIHWRPLVADKDTFPVHLREAGMLLTIGEDSKTYQLANDLVTWNVFVTPTAPTPGGGDGTPAPGTGGNTNTTATIISGNFGAWTALPSQNANIFDKQIDLQYKADLTAFPNRSTVFLTGQFGLKSDFVGTEITLGTLPVSARPKAKLKKWMACKGTELYLVVETTGEVKLVSKDGFDLPVATAGTEENPYFIETFFNPDIAVVEPTVYTYTRTQNFTRNNCGAGHAGSIVEFSKSYTSLVSLADAQNIAMADSSYNTIGQANANAGGTCTLEKVIGTLSVAGRQMPNNDISEAYFVFTAVATIPSALPHGIQIQASFTYNVIFNTTVGPVLYGGNILIAIPAGQLFAEVDIMSTTVAITMPGAAVSIGATTPYDIVVTPNKTTGDIPIEIVGITGVGTPI